MTDYYRKDSPQGITPINPDFEKDVVEHITKARGTKTRYTSVSNSLLSIRWVNGVEYKVVTEKVLTDSHEILNYDCLLELLTKEFQDSARKKRILVNSAITRLKKSKESLIDWSFNTERLDRNKRIKFCGDKMQSYFIKIK